MGRLFWKAFLAFWCALLLAGAGVGTVVWLHRAQEPDRVAATLVTGPRSAFVIDLAASALGQGGPEALGTLLLAHERPNALVHLMVVDPAGKDILGRPVPPGMLEDGQEGRDRAENGGPRLMRRVVSPQGVVYQLFLVADGDWRRRPMHRLPPAPPSLFIPIGVGVLASLVFSAFLAWYLAKPIRNLRWAFGAVADGRLETRVTPRMAGRRDEVADLGRDFDRMAGHLQQLVASQRRLLHDVSHELRSPLARLQAAIGLARQDPRKAEATLERIEREAVRLDTLVGELLTLSRLEAGAGSVPVEEVDLVELVASIVDDAGFEAQAQGRRVEFSGVGEEIATVRAELLHRAFENVIRNGVKFTAQGSAVEVRVARRPDAFVVTVADRGPGVPEADLPAIFEPFYRGENGQGAAGFGLGLAIAKRALEAHGGHISARNRPGGGLEVSLDLPLPVPALG